MVVGKIGSEIREAGRHESTAHHLDLSGATQNATQCNRAVMAAEAELARSRRIAGLGIKRCRLVDLVVGLRIRAIPEWAHSGGVMRGVTENAHLAL